MKSAPETPLAFKRTRESLGLSIPQLAKLIGLTPDGVRRMEKDPAVNYGRPVNPVAARLLRAYAEGYRPPDWPSQRAS